MLCGILNFAVRKKGLLWHSLEEKKKTNGEMAKREYKIRAAALNIAIFHLHKFMAEGVLKRSVGDFNKKAKKQKC